MSTKSGGKSWSRNVPTVVAVEVEPPKTGSRSGSPSTLSLFTSVAVASAGDPWGQCPAVRKCKDKFRDGSCDMECLDPVCLRDGFDCHKDLGYCNPGHIPYCRNHYSNSHCDQGCDSAACGWDGSDCFTQQSSVWAQGTLVLHANIPKHDGVFNSSLLWALSVLLQTPLKLRGSSSLAASKKLFDFDAQQLANLLTQSSPVDSNGSLLFLQVDNRPCSRVPSTCFPYATEAASFLRAMMSKPAVFTTLPELKAVINIRGVREEIGSREEELDVKEVEEATPVWLWAVVAIAVGLLLGLGALALLVVRRVRQRQQERGSGERVRHRSTITDAEGKTKSWPSHAAPQEQRARSCREKEKLSLRKKKKAKETEKKRRREPLGEDAIRMRPLKREQDIGSDTDFTQSSMEDINARCSRRQDDATICDHRGQEQKQYRSGGSQSRRPVPAPSRGWERNAMPPPLLSPPQQSAEWCGPDGSVVLIRAVRSGLDRVVLELLRAGVQVNNTDHTGRSALHWSASVNHLSLTRTLIRYGAAVDLQDNKGETPLFLAALYGCYDTTRLLLLHGANLELHDRRGRRPTDVAREGMHHQVLELLLAHQIQRGPVPVETTNDMLWEERTLMYSPWVGTQGLPGRSASFSGIVGCRDMTPPPQSDWSVGRVQQYPSPQNWRPQINQSATALVPPRIMGRSPRPISTLQEVTSEDEDRDRHQDASRAGTPHFLCPQPAPRQRSFSCTQHALQRRASAHQPEPNYVIVTDRSGSEPVERIVVPPPTETAIHLDHQPVGGDTPSRAEPTLINASSLEPKSRGERLNNTSESPQTAL
ncbi:neurogenic locus notch homolog protein 1 isoform X2 [Synchiropus splendidus]|uniref:neurogenic locus notch homolog protein 1 isoform X2 n=1 Tax=Synchiropus splendidus TaxID=270530 RepID=UPI00237EBE7C|nr:neurogenic locus notch homolog protein 1 isoform X2 [Synchiropus splendidus]